jgi:hypothetical protein
MGGGIMNTNICTRSLFFAPKLWEPLEGTRESIPPYDPAKRTLGKLCPGKHEWGNTGQTLLRKPNLTCPVCEAEKKREKRKAKREAQPVAG